MQELVHLKILGNGLPNDWPNDWYGNWPIFTSQSNATDMRLYKVSR